MRNREQRAAGRQRPVAPASGEDQLFPPVFPGEVSDERIVMGHGAGGLKMHRLIGKLFLRHFGSRELARLEDGAVVGLRPGRVCITTDSFVVQPLFFAGGDIGRLAVAGTVNDLAVMGAEPEFLSVSFILREGLEMAALERICRSIGATAREAGVSVVTGDTKVIERGSGEEMYINTTGLGRVGPGVKLGAGQVRPGDKLLINGGIGEHEAAIAVARGAYRFRAAVRSDGAPLAGLTRALVRGGGVRMMRDPTRGGLATALNEFADATGLGFVVDEAELPVSRAVRGVAELLGLDPLYMANEGKVVVVADPARAGQLVRAMRQHRYGREARTIGEVVRRPGGAWLRTRLGSLRPLMMLEGEQLPRIC